MHANLRILYLLVALTAVLGMVWWFQDPQGALAHIEGTQFAIEDTSKVDKIFIADMDGNAVTLTRPTRGRLWDLNGRFKAREDAVALLLKTFKRAAVQGPVAEAARPNVIRLLASRGKKVEIYQGGNQPVKTWYVGTATPSHTGTYMLLETQDGKGQDPYVVHMEGFTGYLSTRFFTNEREWRYTGLFDFPGRTLQRIEVETSEDPQNSYSLEVNARGTLRMEGTNGEAMDIVDTAGVQTHFLRFKKVHLETYRSRLSDIQEDSLRQAKPAFVLRAWGRDGRSSSVQVHWKPRTGLDRDATGELMAHDGEHLYGVTEHGEVVLLQRFVFDPLIRPREELLRQRVPPVATEGLPMPTN
ncbi:MAG: hypothetical protein RLZZ314_578 [Bacteroidota bacterium]|jgi:hypothetical protein|nr:hypothetical protein [Bacteroidota bacterium]